MKNEIALPKSNLWLRGSGHDRNGNKIVKLSFADERGFSIQTGGSLKLTGNILRGLKTAKDMQRLSKSDLATISKEVCKYIKEFGTSTQMRKLKTF